MAKSKAKRTGSAKKGATKPRAARGGKASRKARKAPARKASAKRAPGKPARVAARKAVKPAQRASAQKQASRRPAPKAPVRKVAAKSAAKTAAPRRAPALDRPRRTVAETEPTGVPSSLDLDRKPSAARSGRKELVEKLKEHTSTGPALTGGDIDADWESAEAVGDEAPGGDNPTPDQDVVDDIGRALGVEYDDDEELQGGDEIVARDQHRWELDPASKEDFEDEE